MSAVAAVAAVAALGARISDESVFELINRVCEEYQDKKERMIKIKCESYFSRTVYA